MIRPSRPCRYISVASAIRGTGLSGIEEEPDWSKRGQTSTHHAERQFDIGPEEDWRGVVDDIVRMLEVFARNGVCGDYSRNADCTYSVV